MAIMSLHQLEENAMSTEIQITTVKALRSAIRNCDAVYAQLRFGMSERWVKITKSEAIQLADDLGDETTPECMSMYSGVFGSLTSGDLYLG
jgi:hypothetical protein